MQNADGKSQIENGTNRRAHQVTDNHVSVGHVARMRESHEGALSQVDGNDGLRAVRRHDSHVATLAATALENGSSGQVRAGQRRDPVLIIIVAQIASVQPLLGKTRRSLQLHGINAGGQQNRQAALNRELRGATGTS